MDRTRNVMITLGNKTYSVETSLDDSTLNRVIGNIQESFSDEPDIDDQEKSLLLACLDLSYRLDASLSVKTGSATITSPESDKRK